MVSGICEEVEQNITQVGYHLMDAEEWWEVIWSSAMRGLVEQLAPEQQQAFRQRPLARVAELQTDDGLWMDVEVRITVGTVPTNAG